METRISVADLQASLAEVLERVCERGERFVIEQDGRVLAALGPSPDLGVPLSVVLERIGHLMVPEGFSDDLEEVRRSLPPLGEPPTWRD